MSKGERVVKPSRNEIHEVRNFSKKIVIKNFFEALNNFDKICAPIIFIIISASISIGVVKMGLDGFEFIKPIIEVIFSYLSITIGFSITSLIFMFENVKKLNLNRYMKQILAIIIVFIIHGLILITLFVIQLAAGSLIHFTGVLYYVSNFIGITFYLSMIFINIYLFYIIIKTVYYFLKITIEEK